MKKKKKVKRNRERERGEEENVPESGRRARPSRTSSNIRLDCGKVGTALKPVGPLQLEYIKETATSPPAKYPSCTAAAAAQGWANTAAGPRAALEYIHRVPNLARGPFFF